MTAPDTTTRLEGPRRLLALLYAVAGLAYLVWRAGTLNPVAPGFSGLVWGLEAAGYLYSLLQVHGAWRRSERRAAAPAATPHATRVEVVVQAAGEDSADVIRKSLLAALALQGPHEVTLLDDDPRAERARLADDLGCRYVARRDIAQPGTDSLNHALADSRADVIALIAAGSAPRRELLRQTLGHFQDERVAFVQTAAAAQDLETLRAGDAPSRSVWGEPFLSARVLQQGRDALGAALLTGNGALIRRAALVQVGGLGTGTGAGLQADALQTGLRLHAAGWRSVFHPQVLLFNVAPEAPSEAPRRHLAAALGGLQVWRREGLLLRRGLSTGQRLAYLGAVLAPVDAWRAGLLGLVPAAVLLGGVLPTQLPLTALLAGLLPYAAVRLWLQHELARGERSPATPWRAGMAHSAGLLATLVARLTGQRQLPLAGTLQAVAALQLGTLLLAAFWGGAAAALPLDDAIAAGAGAAGVAGLALLVLRQVSTWPQAVRGQHRFPVPLAAELICPNGERLNGTIDDLSESGLRFYGTLLPSLAVGQAVQGSLHLPDGPMGFDGEVRHLGTEGEGVHQPRSIGCSIRTGLFDQRRLETFLYGADLPWQLQAASPQRPTLLSRLLPHWVAGPADGGHVPRRWNAAQLREHVTAPTLPALVAAPDARHTDDLLISYAPLPEGLPLILNVFRRIAVPARGVVLHRLPPAPGTESDLYTYRLEPAPLPLVPATYQLVDDTRLLLDDQPKWTPAPPAQRPAAARSDAPEHDYA